MCQEKICVCDRNKIIDISESIKAELRARGRQQTVQTAEEYNLMLVKWKKSIQSLVRTAKKHAELVDARKNRPITRSMAAKIKQGIEDPPTEIQWRGRNRNLQKGIAAFEARLKEFRKKRTQHQENQP